MHSPTPRYLLFLGAQAACTIALVCPAHWFTLAVVAPVLWTLEEYVAHRFLLHNATLAGLHATHRSHHKHPEDARRLLIPVEITVAFALVNGVACALLFDVPYALWFLAGFTPCYLASRTPLTHSTMPPTTVAPGCAFGFWHMWGVLDARKPTDDVWCISGSSLAMVVHRCELDVATQLDRCSRLRATVTPCNVFRVVRAWLESELPDDCHLRCNGRMTVLLRNVYRGFAVERVTSWRDKADLIDCLMAACIPVRPTKFRGQWYVDCVHHCPSADARMLPSRTVLYVPDETAARELYALGVREGTVSE